MNNLPEQAIKECQRLLVGNCCNLRQGLCVSGENTTVSVLVLPDTKDAHYKQVRIVCDAAGHLKVDWERIGFWLTDEATGGNEVVVLDSEGRSPMLRMRYSDSSLLMFRDPGDFGMELLRQVAPQLVLLGPGVVAGVGPPKVPTPKISMDGALSATMEVMPDQSLRILVDTTDDSLRNGQIVFQVRSRESGAVLHERTFRLAFRGGTRGQLYV